MHTCLPSTRLHRELEASLLYVRLGYCEGHLAVTSVTPLVPRVDVVDVAARQVSPSPSSLHICPSQSCHLVEEGCVIVVVFLFFSFFGKGI